MSIELRENPLGMRAKRVTRYAETCAGGLRTKPLRQRLKHIELAWSKPLGELAVSRMSAIVSSVNLAFEPVTEIAGLLNGAPNGTDDVTDLTVLGQVAIGVRSGRLEEAPIAVHRGEHDDPGVWPECLHQPRAVGAGPIGEQVVHEHDVGVGTERTGDVADGGGGADDDDVAFAVEGAGKRLGHELMVVDQGYPDHHGTAVTIVRSLVAVESSAVGK